MKHMESFHINLTIYFTILIILLNTSFVISGKYAAIFSFGDSLTDTGNRLKRSGGTGTISRLPYGETYFHQPTGRFSDGRIILDFIAQSVGLPLMRPYLDGGSASDLRTGVNFAVGGATALSSLGEQLGWFKNVMSLLSSSGANSSQILNNSLFILGEFGGNDYFPLIFHNNSASMIESYTPKIIQAISSAANELISFGAKTIVIPGVTPFGCIPDVIGAFQKSGIEGYYDPQTGCINWLNGISEYHNQQLQNEVQNLREQYPQVAFSYADYYEDLMRLYRNPKNFGFQNSLDACCHNCGGQNTQVCDNPSIYMSWDGIHYTEATYNLVAKGLMDGQFAYPPIPQ